MYGFLQAKVIDEKEENYFEKEFDKWLNSKGIKQDKIYKRLKKDGTIEDEMKTLPTLIRNIIHHPENKNNSYSREELKESIKSLVNIIKTIN